MSEGYYTKKELDDIYENERKREAKLDEIIYYYENNQDYKKLKRCITVAIVGFIIVILETLAIFMFLLSRGI